jgi:ABC-type sugar transport system ATPase subunit
MSAANVFVGREPLRRVMGLQFANRLRMREEAEETLRVRDIHINRLDVPIRALSGGQRQ